MKDSENPTVTLSQILASIHETKREQAQKQLKLIQKQLAEEQEVDRKQDDLFRQHVREGLRDMHKKGTRLYDLKMKDYLHHHYDRAVEVVAEFNETDVFLYVQNWSPPHSFETNYRLELWTRAEVEKDTMYNFITLAGGALFVACFIWFLIAIGPPHKS